MSSEQHVSSGDDPNVSLQQEQEELEGDNGATLIDVLEVNINNLSPGHWMKH